MPEEDAQNADFQQHSVGMRLRGAREAAGLSRSDIANRTKIAERHLASIEENAFSQLPGRTYAVGFSRAYARAVGLDEGEIAQAVRDLLSESEDYSERPQPAAFEPGDPARVPGSRIAWLAALGALAVIVLVYIVWRSFLAPAVSLPDLTQEEEQQVASATADAAPPAKAVKPAAPPAGPVVFTALEPNVWIKFYDADGEQLMQKQMAEGERYTVPADAEGPQVRTGRPDAFEITVGGKKVPPLADKPILVKDVPVTADALLARQAPDADGEE
jgi:transcriptional regulator with XRE-family HTH domain